MNNICTYDGITALNMDTASIDHILRNPERYNLKGRYDVVSNYELGFTGRFKNIGLQTGANNRGKGFYLGGSLHKFKNGDHNWDQFTWEEFQQVVQAWINEFQFDPLTVDVCGIEAGVNIIIPEEWNIKACTIVENVLLLKGRPKEKSVKHYKNGGVGFEVVKGECSYKFYDKGRQYKTSNEILRIEKRYKKGRQLEKHGIRTLGDLLQPANHKKICSDLIKSFKDLLLFQPELLKHPSLSQQDKEFVIKYNNANAWLHQLKENKYFFKKDKKYFDDLINKYCEYNLKDEILKLKQSMLQ